MVVTVVIEEAGVQLQICSVGRGIRRDLSLD
jgi:hypothetical protein